MARRRRSRYRRNPIENHALVVGGILAVGIAAAIIFWPKKAVASTTQPQLSGPPLTGGQLTFEPGARDYKLQVGGTITIALPSGREYHVDDFPGEAHSGGKILQGTLNPNGSFSFKAIGPGKATALIDTRGATQPMALTIEVV